MKCNVMQCENQLLEGCGASIPAQAHSMTTINFFRQLTAKLKRAFLQIVRPLYPSMGILTMSCEHTGSLYPCSNSYGGWSINLDVKLPSKNDAYAFSFCCWLQEASAIKRVATA